MICQYCKAINFTFFFFALQINIDNLEMCSLELVKHFFNRDTEALNVRILVCIFWGILRVQSSCFKQNPVVCNCQAIAASPILFTSLLRICHDVCYISVIYIQVGGGGNTMLDDLFLFFLVSPAKNIFQKHLQYLVVNCIGAPFQFISKYFLDEGLLHCSPP